MKRVITKKKWSILTISMILLAGGLTLVSYTDKDFKLLKNLEIYSTLLREINLFYVDDTNVEELIETSIEAMLETLDPYTVYISETHMDDFRLMTTGQYGGIGSLVRRNGDYVVIAEIYKDFPADNAGLKTGDIITEIDGQSIKNIPLEKVSEMLKGMPNTKLEITYLQHGSDKLFKKTVTREKIQIPSVPYYGMVDQNTGYIRLGNFTQNCSKDVKKAFTELKETRGMKSLIIDLRSNPGGILDESVEISNFFVEKGKEIVSTRGKMQQLDKTYLAQNAPLDMEIPLVILTNRGSASASEIVAGSLQDLDRAVIVGQRTFGKGLVQATRPLGYNSQVKMTTAKYYIPSGRCIQAIDYSHRNEDGSVGYIPDSLISEFTTKGGRKVYDGGGIVPDIDISPEPYSKIATSLYTKFMFFDFATQYVALHEKIPAVENFVIDEKIFNDFVAFLQDKDFDYQTQSEELLKDLEKMAKAEKYYGFSEEEFSSLRKKLTHDKNKDLQTFNEEIKQLLKEEIANRYYYQEGQIKASFPNDLQLKKAMEVLHNQDLYRSILNGTHTPDKTEKDLVQMESPGYESTGTSV